jgi:Domain of unknown function (DUF4136)
MIGVLLSVLVLLSQSWPDPGQVVSSVDKGADFDSVRTYAWERGVEPVDKSVGKLITAAIDAELAARGLKQVDQPAADVLVRYDAVGSTYVDLDELQRTTKKDPSAVAPTKALGSLAISMHRNKSPQRMWLGHARDVIDATPAAREASIRKIVAHVFTTYPKKAK